jgi:hypothetical protein
MIPDIGKLVAKFDHIAESLDRIVYLLEQQAARETQRAKETDCNVDEIASHGNERRNDLAYAQEIGTL